MVFIKATKCRHQASTRSYSNQLDIQAPKMTRLILMAMKFTKGMTYQWKAKDMANAQEDIYGVACIVN